MNFKKVLVTGTVITAISAAATGCGANTGNITRTTRDGFGINLNRPYNTTTTYDSNYRTNRFGFNRYADNNVNNTNKNLYGARTRNTARKPAARVNMDGKVANNRNMTTNNSIGRNMTDRVATPAPQRVSGRTGVGVPRTSVINNNNAQAGRTVHGDNINGTHAYGVMPGATGVAPGAMGVDATGVVPGAVGTNATGVAPGAIGTNVTGVAPGAIGTNVTGAVPRVLGADTTGAVPGNIGSNVINNTSRTTAVRRVAEKNTGVSEAANKAHEAAKAEKAKGSTAPKPRNVTKTAVAPKAQNVTKSTATPKTQNVTKSTATPKTQNVTKSTVTPKTQNTAKSATAPTTQNTTKSTAINSAARTTTVQAAPGTTNIYIVPGITGLTASNNNNETKVKSVSSGKSKTNTNASQNRKSVSSEKSLYHGIAGFDGASEYRGSSGLFGGAVLKTDIGRNTANNSSREISSKDELKNHTGIQRLSSDISRNYETTDKTSNITSRGMGYEGSRIANARRTTTITNAKAR